MPDKKNDQNRRRKWAPKRRTGCATCKARHVKCDEVRPVCRRCLSSGFKCEGYALTPKKGSEEDSSSPPEQGDDAPERKSKPAQKHFPIIAASPEVKVLKESPLPLTLAPGTPYRDVAAQRGIKYFTELTASMVGRSRAAPYFWKVLIPQAAWQYPSVRHAVLASAIMNQALMKKKRAAGDWESTQLQVMKHTNQAMHSVLTEKVPLDVVLLTSATLGILDLFHGSWDNACIHVTTGAKLAKEAREKGINDPYISFYCQAFASALPGVLRPAQEGKGRKVVHENACVRLEEAVASLEMALADIGCIWAKLKTLEIPDKPRIMIVLNNAKIETEWLLPRWRQLLENERQLLPDKSEPGVPMHEVESPWSVITAKLNDYLDHGGMFDTAKFEIAMERTMPFFTLAKSGPHIQMRELAVELMWRGMLLRKRDESPESIFPLAI